MDLLQSSGHLSLAHRAAVEVESPLLASCLLLALAVPARPGVGIKQQLSTVLHAREGKREHSERNNLPPLLLVQVLSMTRVDHNLGLALLLATPSGTALHHLRTKQSSIMSSYSRVIVYNMLSTTSICMI